MKNFHISNRRYIGNKAKLLDWIFRNILENTTGTSFLDLFAGTGVVASEAMKYFSSVKVNDFLYSNQISYEAFFGAENFNEFKVKNFLSAFNKINPLKLKQNYFDETFGGKYFGLYDARKIGFVRESIEELFISKKINSREYAILLTSLVYSIDKISNTVGHYEAYIKKPFQDFQLELGMINPLEFSNKEISIFREDSNALAKTISADVVFLDPPYNSRQYSRFYHVLENLIKWEKPEVFGVARKPKEENMSEYCRSSAPKAFDDLIQSLDCKYIAVTYNNTYISKSSSSKNKISLEEIRRSLDRVGATKVFTTEHKFFNAGKTDFNNHQELLFITEIFNEKN